MLAARALRRLIVPSALPALGITTAAAALSFSSPFAAMFKVRTDGDDFEWIAASRKDEALERGEGMGGGAAVNASVVRKMRSFQHRRDRGRERHRERKEGGEAAVDCSSCFASSVSRCRILPDAPANKRIGTQLRCSVSVSGCAAQCLSAPPC